MAVASRLFRVYIVFQFLFFRKIKCCSRILWVASALDLAPPAPAVLGGGDARAGNANAPARLTPACGPHHHAPLGAHAPCVTGTQSCHGVEAEGTPQVRSRDPVEQGPVVDDMSFT